MASKESIQVWLSNNCTMNTPQGCAEGTGLTQLYQQVTHQKKVAKKAEVIHALSNFYANKQNILDIWNGSPENKLDGFSEQKSLDEVEKRFVSLIVQLNGQEFRPLTKRLAAELGLAFRKSPSQSQPVYRSRSSGDPFDDNDPYHPLFLVFLHLLKEHYPDSKISLLFPGGKEMPFFVLEVLQSILPPFQYEYPPFKPSKKDSCICRENRISDFAALVTFTGSQQIKVKMNTFEPTKAKLAKMVETIGFPEVCDAKGSFCSPKEAGRIHNFKVALPLFVLAADAELLDIDNTGVVKPGKKSVNLLANPPHIFAKKMFESYMKNNYIFETDYIPHIELTDDKTWVPWEKCRKTIVRLLKTCPLSQWVSFQDFEKYMIIFHHDFFRELLDYKIRIHGLNLGYGYYGSPSPDWEECETQLIRLVFSFLGAMGILDIAYTPKTPRFKEVRDDYCVGISGFRITPQGAWILGMTKDYKPADTAILQSAEGSLCVQPDHTVMITGLKSRIEHESYLSQFLTKVSVDDHVSVYKVDFQSMVRAYNCGIEPNKIKTYLEKAGERPLSENVLRSFSDWQEKVGKVKIRTVTLLETDDQLLLEELIHVKGMDKLLGDKVSHGVIIDVEKNQSKVKTIVEKNGWFVKL